MEIFKKKTNTYWFEMILSSIKENGVYIWPDTNGKYTMKNGKFHASKKEIDLMKKITLPSFHRKLIVI